MTPFVEANFNVFSFVPDMYKRILSTALRSVVVGCFVYVVMIDVAYKMSGLVIIAKYNNVPTFD